MSPISEQPLEGQNAIVRAVEDLISPTVIDVGAGDGKWGRLLEGVVVDAIEVWEPYIRQHKLRDLYRTVFRADVRAFGEAHGWGNYDVAIFGDVLEHMTKKEAARVLYEVLEAGVVAYITIPVSLCIQDGMKRRERNPYETHVAQWTHEEVIAELEATHLHTGPNPNGLVQIGTYEVRP